MIGQGFKGTRQMTWSEIKAIANKKHSKGIDYLEIDLVDFKKIAAVVDAAYPLCQSFDWSELNELKDALRKLDK